MHTHQDVHTDLNGSGFGAVWLLRLQVHLLLSEAKPVSCRYLEVCSDIHHLFLHQTGSLDCATESTSTSGKMKITEELLLSGLYTYLQGSYPPHYANTEKSSVCITKHLM